MENAVMKIEAKFSVDLSDKQIAQAGVHAEELGLGYKDPGKQELVRRLLIGEGLTGLREALKDEGGVLALGLKVYV